MATNYHSALMNGRQVTRPIARHIGRAHRNPEEGEEESEGMSTLQIVGGVAFTLAAIYLIFNMAPDEGEAQRKADVFRLGGAI